MYNIHIKVFNTPSVTMDNKIITFPFKKAEALFYYLLSKNQAARDELVSIFWGEADEETAKKNLRHAMYMIRKAFGIDIIISPQKSIVMMNPDITVSSDLQVFLNQDGITSINAYTGEFLQGFNVKDGEQFEAWILTQREYYKELYRQKLYVYISECVKNNDLKHGELYAKLLINEEPFDENSYRLLMKIYAMEGVYNKVIELYKKLATVLEKELGISPDIDTKNLLETILYDRDLKNPSKKKNPEVFFFGRVEELEVMKFNYNSFLDGSKHKSIIIVGEAGIGKTKLKDRFIELIATQPSLLLQFNCYQAEESYFLKPWNDIFARLKDIIVKNNIKIPAIWTNIIAHIFPMFADDNNLAVASNIEKIDSFKFQVAEEAIIGVLNKISQNQKIILVFEDLQWMDNTSLTLLGKIMMNQKSKNIMLLGTCRSGYGEKVENFISIMSKYDTINKLELQRFNRKEVEEISEKLIPEYQWTKELQKQIFEETSGNAFFLVELLNTIKDTGEIGELNSKAQDILKSRFIDISEEGKKILNIISVFFDEVSIELLRQLSGKDEMELIDILDELKDKMILKETENDNISYEFTHQKLREFIYQQQSLGRRKLLHNRIALAFEQHLHKDRRDRFIYPKLIYHYKSSGNKLSELKYRIKNLDMLFDLNHELFPVISTGSGVASNTNINANETIEQLKIIELLMNKLILEEEKDYEDIARLDMEYLHLKGRYLIREGEYDTGISCILEMIDKALKFEDKRYAQKGYRQMIYYSIQIHDIQLMDEYIQLGLELAMHHLQHEDTSILLRLKGLSRVMQGKYEEAEEILKQAIGMFNSINQDKDKYILNIAACYNYIGEIRRHNMKFATALDYYDKAINICEVKNIPWGLTIFYTNAGQAALDMGDYHRAKAYLNLAIKMYQQMDMLWGRSTAEAYMSLVEVKNGEYSSALDNLKRAESYADKLKSPYELGLIYRVKAEIKASMRRNSRINNIFSSYLDMELNEYCNLGINFLKKLKNPYEIQILKALKKHKE